MTLSCDLLRPGVMLIPTIGKGDKKSGIADCSHLRENPLREDRSCEPSIVPARRINNRLDSF